MQPGSTVFFENAYALIAWDTELQAVYLHLHGFAQGEAFKEVHEKALELSKLKRASRWIVDLSEQGVISLADQDWIANYWLPTGLQLGLKRMALVLPKSKVAQLATYRIAKQVANINEFSHVFETLEAARKWLPATK